METSDAEALVSDWHLKQFREEGFFVLEKAFSGVELESLRAECDRFVREKDEEMESKGVEQVGISVKGKRYFVTKTVSRSLVMHDFVFGPWFEAICRRLLGNDAVLFHDQLVVKAGEIGLPFSWHQDSGYLPFDHEPYVTCWTPLDDVNEENGTVYLLPYSRLGIRSRVTHIQDPVLNDKVGYFGPDPGEPVIASAGSIAVFSSVCFHRSGANTTPHPRRVMLSQYAKAPIANPVTGELHLDGVPFLRDGQRVVGVFQE